MVSGRVTKPMRRLLAQFWSDERGLSALEFALVSTFILVPLLLGATELGRRAWFKTQFENAVEAGMDYAALTGCPNENCSILSSSSFTTGIVNAVHKATSLGTAVTVGPLAGCGGAYYCYGCPGGSGVSLTATSGTCGSGGTSGTYAGVTATYTYTPLFGACGGLLPSSICSNTAITWTVTTIARVY
jgi:Flp pilus assembly pilin Flp